jgi:DNA-binding NtrC family response regulator
VNILLAEDEPGIGLTLKEDLEDAGHQVQWAKTGSEALKVLDEGWFDCLITDVRMPGGDGIDLLKRAKAKRPETEVLVMTAYATVEQAVEAMREGAFDYFQKPFLNEVVLERIGQIERLRHLQDENERLRRNLDELPDALPNIIGTSAPMQDVFKLIRTVAPSDTSVLVEGESGTGKERVARAIHRLSPRRENAFVAISCGALPETLLEDELFGHERGAFTDAARARKGRFELAQGGTVFLDDIDDMTLPTQVKLLRVLQEREFERVGGEKTIRVDLRVISATKVPLEELVRKGTFREDLFYRLKVVTIGLPPLRERRGDLPLLVAHFIERYGKGQEYEVGTNDLATMEAYDWPGNIRELENSIERAIALAGGKKKLRREHLLPSTRSLVTSKGDEVDQEKRTLKEVLVEVEKQHLKLVLASTGGHRTNAAKVLGISRKVLWEKLKDYGIQ